MRRFIPNFRKFFMVVVAGFILPGLAMAHSFNVTMVVPGGQSAQAIQAFLVASAERDSHAGEESDGHLGGLDVYITAVEQDGNDTTLAARVLASEPDIIALVGADLAGSGLEAMFDGADAWLLPVYTASARAEQEFQQNDISGDVPTLTYIAARLIDIAVRDQGGVDDRDALTSSLADY